MVAVVSGNSLGLTNSSRNILGGDGALGNAVTGRNGEQIYVNSTTGNLVIQDRDEFLTGIGIHAPLFRTYNSQGLLNDDNADNWRLGVHLRLSAVTGTVNTAGSSIIKTFGDGAELVYTYNTTLARYVSTAGDGAHDSLTFNSSNSQWTWTDGSERNTETYDVNGRLTFTRDQDGNTLIYTYTGALLTQVTDNSSPVQTTYFDYTGNNLTAIRVVSNSVTQTLTRYTYDTSNRLTEVRVDLSPSDNSIADGKVFLTTYTYDATSKRVASISQGNGVTVAATVSFTYQLLDGQYRVKTYTDAENRVTTYTYTLPSSTGGGSTATAPANTGVLSTTENQTTTDTYNLNTGALTTPSGGSGSWAATTSLGAGSAVQIKLDANGNGFALFKDANKFWVRRYTRSNNTWAAAVQISQTTLVAQQAKLSIDAAGNAIVGWSATDFDDGGPEVEAISSYARVYDVATGTWSTTFALDSAASDTGVPAVAINGSSAFAANYERVGAPTQGVSLKVTKISGGVATSALVESLTTDVSSASLAVDAQGFASVVFTQPNSGVESFYVNRYDPATSTWGTQALLENSSTAIADAQIAFDANGNGFAIWRQGTDIIARRYVKATGVWGGITTLDSGADTVSIASLAVDAAGNALVGWVQNSSSVASLLAKRYDVGTGSWGSETLVEPWASAVNATSISVAIDGANAVATWVQNDGTADSFYVARYTAGAWGGPAGLENTATVTTSPAAAIDSQGNIVTAWEQGGSISQRRYNAGSGGTPYYPVPAGATWASIAQTLYGSSSAASQLQTALGNPTLTTGLQLTGFPASITVTTTTPVTVPAYYTVPAGATWTSITQAIYGISDANAVAALQAATGTPTLTTGLHLTVPLTLTYSTSGGGGGSTLYLQTDISDPLGFVTSFTSDASGRLTGMLSPTTGGARVERRYAYDADGNVTQVTDDPSGLNRITIFQYDANGNLTLSRDSLGNTVSRTYSATNQLLTETVYTTPDPDGSGSGQPSGALTTRYAYDAEDHLRFVVSSDGRVAENQYTSTGLLSASLQYGDALYDLTGLAVTAAITEAQLTTWAGSRDLTKLQRVNFTYDFRGNVATATAFATTNSSGVGQAAGSSLTRYVYDQRGQLLSRIDARGEATTGVADDYQTAYTYDGLGRVLTSVEWIKSGTGGTRTTTTLYDDALNKTTVTYEHGLISTSTYNKTGALISLQNTGPSSANLGTTTYTYDANGRLRFVTDPTGVREHVLYDETGRKVATIDADGTLTELVYDRANQLIKTIVYANRLSAATVASLISAGQPANVTLATVRTSLDSVPNRNPAQDRITRAVYDSAGRQVYSIDDAGAVTKFVYDGAGRLTDEIAYATLFPIPRATDQVLPSAVTVATSPSDRRTRHFYDNAGNRLATLDASGYLVEFIYDAAGRLSQQIAYADATPVAQRPSGTLAQLRPALDNETTTDPERDISSYVLYDGQGRQVGVLDGEGYLTETVYDAAGYVASVTRYDARLTWSASSTLASLKAAVPGAAVRHTTSYLRDGQGLVRQETDFQGTVNTFDYDKAGNLITATRAQGTAEVRTTQARYDALGRVVAELTAEGSTLITGTMTPTQIDQIWNQYAVRYAYDLAGRRVSATDQNGYITYFYYDGDGRQTHVVNADREVTETLYDARGRITGTRTYNAPAAAGTLTGGLATSAFTNLLTVNNTLDARTVTTYAYTATGQEQTTSTAESAAVTRRFDAFGDETTRLDQVDATAQRSTVYTYDALGQVVTRTNGTGPAAHVETYVYDAFGRVKQVTDQYSNVRKTEYDRLGRVLATVDPVNSRRAITYDAFARVLTTVDAFTRTTSYAYNDTNRSVTVTTPEGIVVSTVNNRHGQAVTVTDGRNTATTYAYDENGQLETISDALGTLESRTYDRAGRQLQAIDARGAITTLQYDAANRVLTRTVDSAAGGLALVTTYTYDDQGRVRDVTDPNGILTRTEYDRDGRVTAVIVDPGASPKLNLRTEYQYNRTGDVILMTEGVGGTNPRRVKYVYDALGRRIEEIVDPTDLGGTLNLRTQYKFDANGNVTRRIDAKNNSTWYVYDKADRLAYTIDALGGVSETKYNVEGRVEITRRFATTVTVPGSTVDRIALQDFSAPAATNADRRQQHVYDRDGREVYLIDDVGGTSANLASVTQKLYDGNGNVTRTRVIANAISAVVTGTGSNYKTIAEVETAISSAGSSASTLASSDRVSWSVYDIRDRAVFTVDGLGAVVRNEYDGNGNVVAMTEFATTNTAGPYDASTLTTWATSNASNVRNRVTRTWYDAANRAVFVLDAEGYLTETRHEDSLRKTTEISYAAKPTVAAAATLAQVRSAATAIANASADQSTITELDTAGRVRRIYDAEYSGALANYEEFTYDAVGNKISFRNKKGAVWNYEYDANHRLIYERTPNVDVTTINAGASLSEGGTASLSIVTFIEYDALGNVWRRTEAQGTTSARTTTYEYDALGRQVRTTFPPILVYAAPAGDETRTGTAVVRAETSVTPTSETAYDVFGNSFRNKDIAGGYSYKVYDKGGRVLYEADAENYLTEYTYDVFGNQTQVKRYQNKLTTALPQTGAGISVADITSRASSSAGDRVVTRTYDRLNRMESEVQPAVLTFVPNSSSAGGRKITASPTTFRQYNAFGQAIRESRLLDTLDNAVVNPNVTPNANAWVHDYFYYDNRGLKTAQVDAAGYLTIWEYDETGDVKRSVEYSKAISSWNTSTYSAPVVTTRATSPDAPEGYDREVRFGYDRLNRKTSETLYNTEYTTISGATATPTVGNLQTLYYYDVLGNQTRVNNSAGDTFTYYDALGRVRAIVEPGRDLDGSATVTTRLPLVEMKRDAFGNLVKETRYVNGATSADASTYSPGAAVPGANGDHVTLLQLDSYGNAIRTQDAVGAQRYASFTVKGEVAKEWQLVTNADGVVEAVVTIHQYDKLGRETAIVEPQRLGGSNNLVVTKQSAYNAFGEITSRGSNNGAQERFEYDLAGRVWRTNGNDGVWKVYLYDLAGNATLEIHSKELDLSTGSYTASNVADLTTQRIRTETVYNALGRVVSQRLPGFTSLTGPQAIDSTLSIGYFNGPLNPAAIYQRVMIGGLPAYVVNPDASLAQGGGYYLDAGGNYVQDPSHSVTSVVRIAWDPPTDASVEMLFQYRVSGSTGGYQTLPVATISGNKRAVNVQGLTDVTYEYKLTYRRTTESAHYAEAGGTFRVNGGISTTFSITPTTDPAANIAALPGSFSNGLVTWTAPADTTVSATFRVKHTSSGSWTDVAATRSGSTFQANLLSALSQQGTYDYQVVYRRGGIVIGQNDGQLSSSGAGNIRTATGSIEYDHPLAYQVTGIAALEGRVNGQIAAAIAGTEYYDPGVPPRPVHSRTGANSVVLSWANIGSTPVRVEVDYTTGTWDSWFYNGDWEIQSNGPVTATSERSAIFTSAATGVTYSWNSTGAGGSGITAINGVRVYAETSPGVWTVILSQTSPSAVYGRQISWAPPSSVDPIAASFEWAPAGTSSFSPLSIVQSTDQWAVSINSFSPGTYEYRVRYVAGNRLLSERTGQFTITPSTVTITVATNVRNDIQEIPVTRVNAGLTWSQAPVSGARVEITYWVSGLGGGMFGPVTLGTGPNYTFYFDGAPAGQRYIHYDLMYYAPGQTVPYAKAGGILNVVITDTPVTPSASVLSQYPVYPSGLQTIAAPTGSTNGYLNWTGTPGPTVRFYYWSGSAAEQQLDVELVSGGFRVNTVTLAANLLYNFRVEYYNGGANPYARGTGSFQISRTGVISSYVVNANAPVTQSTATYAPTQSQGYDRWGNVTSFTNAAGKITNYRYNQFDQTIEVKMPEVDVTATTAPSTGGGAGSFTQGRQRPVTRNYYDSLGRLIGTRDANGNVNSLTLNNAGAVLSETHADGGTKWFLYDIFGNQKVINDELNFRTWKNYDAANRLTSTTRQVDKSTTAYDITESYSYDEAGRRKSETNGENETVRYFYDLNGNLSKRRSALGYETSYTYDAQGRKTGETNAISHSLSWTYDYWGRVLTHTDMGSRLYNYDYYRDGQVQRQYSTAAGQDINYSYDQAGHLLQINDTGVGRVTAYAYDSAGRRNREKVTIGGLIHQDTFTTFDELDRVKNLSDLRYGLTYRYDAQGNRTEIAATYYDHNQRAQTQDLWYAYDAMNRVVLSQGANSGGLRVTQSQGIFITYDAAGQRKTAYQYGARLYVQSTVEFWNAQDGAMDTREYTFLDNGFYTEKYDYDGIGRLEQIDTTSEWRYTTLSHVVTSGPGQDQKLTGRSYDKASRQLGEYNLFSQEGAMEGRQTTNFYDDDGRMTTQSTTRAGTVMESAVSYNYDNANVLRSYTVTVHNNSGTAIYNTLYSNGYRLGDTYQDATQTAHSTAILSGTVVPTDGQTTRAYNANGELISFVDSKDANKNRYFANNAAGQPVTVVQGSISDVNAAFSNALRRADNLQRTQHFFFVNGAAVGNFGQAQTNGKYVANFDVNYTPISSEYPADAPETIVAQLGDTPRTLAARVFGDENLWYLIAEANGYTSPDDVIEAGTLVTVPNEVVSLSNTAGSFKPFDVQVAIGDTTPTQPAPPPPASRGGKKGCGIIGQILIIVVAIVVTIFTVGAAAPAAFAVAGSGLGATFATGLAVLGSTAASWGALGAVVLGGIAGSVASQGVAMAMGMQKGFDWKGVALSGISAGVTFGLGAAGVGARAAAALPANVAKYGALAIRAAGASALTQGIAVATGLQSSFSWKEVAISAVSAPVAAKVGGAVSQKIGSEFAGKFASSVTTSLVRSAFGGKMDATTVLADAFGNALGNSIVSPSAPTQVSTGLGSMTGGDADELSEVQVTAQRIPVDANGDRLSNDFGTFDPVPYRNRELDELAPEDLGSGDPALNVDRVLSWTQPRSFLESVQEFGFGGASVRFDTPDDLYGADLIPTAGPSTRGWRSLTDPLMWRKAAPVMAGDGAFQFREGGLDISIFSDQSELVPVVRTQDEVFSQTAIDAFKANDLDLVINGPLYGLLPNTGGALSTMITNGAVDPANVLAEGETLFNGKVVAGRSAPGRFYVSQNDSPGGFVYGFGPGDPPATSRVAFGGGVPLIVNGLKYGPTNVYLPGTSAAAPLSGDPGQYAGQLVQRSNRAFGSFLLRNETNGYFGTGKVIVAHSSSTKALAIVVQPNGIQSGTSLSGVRDLLYGAGFDNALAFDGSDSVTLIRAGKVVVRPGVLKNATIPVGIGVRRQGP
jgi:YD repeat-containing protein